VSTVRHLLGIMKRDLGLKLLAVVLASLAWLYAHGEQTNEATFVTPVEYVLPPNLVLMNDDPLPERVVIVASGTRAALARVQEVNLRYLVDLEASVAGSTEHSFRTPPPGWPQRLRITTVSPAMIRVRFDEQSRRTVPVQLRTRGELPPGFVETGRELLPNEVVLSGAHLDLAELDMVRTVPLDLRKASAGVDAEIALDLTGLHLLPESADSVRLRMQVEEVIAEREYGDVALRFAGELEGRTDLALTPASAVVHLEGPVPLLDALRGDALLLELSGPAESLPEAGAEPAEVPWVEGGEDLGVRLRIDHPRSDRLKILKLAPNRFGVAVIPPEPEPEPPEEGTPAEPDGEPSP
jgi:hypothetical protein